MLHRSYDTIYVCLPLYQKTMKRKLFYAICVFVIACAFTSCDMLGDGCQVCQTVSEENGNVIAWGVEAEYCGQDLLNIKATQPTTVNGVTTSWVCY